MSPIAEPRMPLMAWAVPLTVGVGVWLLLASAAVGDLRPAVIVVGGVAGLTGLAGVLLLAPGRLPDLLMLAAIGTMTVPLDKYLMFEQHVGGWPGLRIALADLPLLLLLPVVLLAQVVGRMRPGLPRPLVWAYLAWIVWAMVTAAGATRPMIASFEVASMVHAFGVALLISAAVPRRLLPQVVLLLAAQVVVHTGFAVAQVATGRNIGAGWFQGASVVQEALDTGAVLVRPSGLFDHPIVYADMLLLMLPVLVGAAVVQRSRLQRFVLLGVAAIGATGLALTLSRGAWIGTAIAAATMLVWMVRQRVLTPAMLRRTLTGAAVAAVLLAIAFGPRVYERLTGSNEGNLRVRFELNWIAVSMVAANPVAGIGLSHFIDEMERYDPTNVKKYFPATVHNLYLLEAAETGVPGLLLMLAVFGAVLVCGAARVGTMVDPLSRVVAIALLSGLVGFMVSQLADFSHRIEPLRSLIWAGVGLLFALQRGGARAVAIKEGAC